MSFAIPSPYAALRFGPPSRAAMAEVGESLGDRKTRHITSLLSRAGVAAHSDSGDGDSLGFGIGCLQYIQSTSTAIFLLLYCPSIVVPDFDIIPYHLAMVPEFADTPAPSSILLTTGAISSLVLPLVIDQLGPSPRGDQRITSVIFAGVNKSVGGGVNL
jgi:hypothetical protein